MTPPPPPPHIHIVALETFWVPLPHFTTPAGTTVTVTEHARTAPDEVAARLATADVVLLSVAPLTAASLDPAVSPRLRMVAVVAAGTDSVDLAACRARGIHVANTPGANAASVANHALALYFATRRTLLPVTRLLAQGDWQRPGTAVGVVAALNGPSGRPPRTAAQEVLGLVGYGAVGRRVADMAAALGMRVLVAGRKGEEDETTGKSEITTADGGVRRTPFSRVLAEATVLVLCVPRTATTAHLISTAELAALGGRDAVLINVARGGVVDEAALVDALRRGLLAGAASDVYAVEPAGPGTSLLLDAEATAGLNLVTTPHVAWCADETNANYNRITAENIDSWLRGAPTNTVV